MDERSSNKATIEDRRYLTCDEVHFGLQTPHGGNICTRAELDSYSLLDAVHLWRQGATDDCLGTGEPVLWRTLSDYGGPDEYVYVESGVTVQAVVYRWISKWRDNYWVVNWGYDGKLRRTRVRFTDIEGRYHSYYAVPWD